MYGRSFGSVLDACEASFPRRTAVVEDNRRLSYSEAIGQIRSLGSGFRTRGLVPGDRVAVLSATASTWLGRCTPPSGRG
jgi:non-ribosomal peptide synthetase component E (peptide arylation enzyme)